MKVGRPPNGFRIIVSNVVQQTVQTSTPAFPRLPSLFEGIKERLKMTGHRDEESKSIKGKWNRRVFVMAGDLKHGIPKVAVVYEIQADSLSIENMLVINSGDDLD